MLDRINAFIRRYVPKGDLIGEAFYAVWMVVISIGLINSGGGNGDLLWFAIAVAFIVNLGWGLIDGITVMHSHVIDEARNDQIVYDLRTSKNERSRRAARDALDETLLSRLDERDKEAAIDALSSGPPGENPYERRYYPVRENWLYALGILSIDVLMVFPIIAPLIIFGGTEFAVYLTRLVSTVIFALLGAAYAKNLNRNKWLAALFLGTLGLIVFTFAYEMGW